MAVFGSISSSSCWPYFACVTAADEPPREKRGKIYNSSPSPLPAAQACPRPPRSAHVKPERTEVPCASGLRVIRVSASPLADTPHTPGPAHDLPARTHTESAWPIGPGSHDRSIPRLGAYRAAQSVPHATARHACPHRNSHIEHAHKSHTTHTQIRSTPVTAHVHGPRPTSRATPLRHATRIAPIVPDQGVRRCLCPPWTAVHIRPPSTSCAGHRSASPPRRMCGTHEVPLEESTTSPFHSTRRVPRPPPPPPPPLPPPEPDPDPPPLWCALPWMLIAYAPHPVAVR